MREHMLNTKQYYLMARMIEIAQQGTARGQWFMIRNDPLRAENQFTAFVLLKRTAWQDGRRVDVPTYEDAVAWVVAQFDEYEAPLRQGTGESVDAPMD